jgi:hypothetical protein
MICTTALASNGQRSTLALPRLVNIVSLRTNVRIQTTKAQLETVASLASTFASCLCKATSCLPLAPRAKAPRVRVLILINTNQNRGSIGCELHPCFCATICFPCFLATFCFPFRYYFYKNTNKCKRGQQGTSCPGNDGAAAFYYYLIIIRTKVQFYFSFLKFGEFLIKLP